MIVPGVFLALLAVLLVEALYLWAGQLARIREEEAYWAARQNRPELYDWAKELDL